ncbi:hypothetical protein CbC4_5016 (plasmid) [Clostridium botulinum BKT015925]|nr:hypothetical protein CbC4_5016 [Clostridium botulinum BKT015925]
MFLFKIRVFTMYVKGFIINIVNNKNIFKKDRTIKFRS